MKNERHRKEQERHATSQSTSLCMSCGKIDHITAQKSTLSLSSRNSRKCDS